MGGAAGPAAWCVRNACAAKPPPRICGAELEAASCMAKGSGIGGFGGGSLEHPRPWLGAQRAGLAPGVPGCLELPGVP